MKVKKGLLLFYIFIVSIGYNEAQTTNGSLGVPIYAGVSTDSILRELSTSKRDTIRIKSLLRLSGIYFRRKSSNIKNLDSALIYAREAAESSRYLNFKDGQNEATFLMCKTYIDIPEPANAKKIAESTYGEQKTRLLLVIGEHYMYQPGQKPENLNQAFFYLKNALRSAQTINSAHWKNESLIALAKYYFFRGDLYSGKYKFLQVISYHQKIGEKYREAQRWSDLGRYMPENDTSYLYKLTCKNNAVNLFLSLNLENEMAHEWVEMADINKDHGRFAEADEQLLRAIAVYKKTKHHYLPDAYISLAESYQFQGDMGKALTYSLLGLKLIENSRNFGSLGYVYMILGDIYRELNEPENSIIYYRKTLGLVDSPIITDFLGYMPLKRLTEGLIQQNQARQALRSIQIYSRRKPAITYIDQQILANSIADCYDALNDRKVAEMYYLKMIELDKSAQSSKSKQISVTRAITGSEAYYIISKFYTKKKEFVKAEPYLRKALSISTPSPVLEKDIRLIESKIDSATGDYLGAMNSYKRYISLKDSIFNVVKNKELSKLKIQFETSQKENDIKLLKKEAQLQTRKLELSTQTRNFTSIGILMLITLFGVFYNQYRLKQRKNFLLEEQQKIINTKNLSLQQLVNEKEWLLKEVHHRVKNNLQIIVSLLNTQSVYLKDEIAVNAILESRHRVQAMSMLHQRIYQSENMASIAMSPYIHELISYLKDSFNTGLRIIFEISIDDIDLDLTRAIPIGLILNEAVTNALKYAFPGNKEGKIKIILSRKPGNFLLLQIQDDGAGLPYDLNLENIKSFGLKLIKGLSEDLGGEIHIENNKGTCIRITFENTLLLAQELH